VAWESGQRQPPLEYLRRVASACAADLNWMLTGERAPSGGVQWEARFARLEDEMRELRALVSAIAERPPPYWLPARTAGNEWLLPYLAKLDLEQAARDVMPVLLGAVPRASPAVARQLEAALVRALRSALPKVLADFLEHLRAENSAADG
jgi:hypothetical protein